MMTKKILSVAMSVLIGILSVQIPAFAEEDVCDGYEEYEAEALDMEAEEELSSNHEAEEYTPEETEEDAYAVFDMEDVAASKTEITRMISADMTLEGFESGIDGFDGVRITAYADDEEDTEFRIYLWEYGGTVPESADEWEGFFTVPKDEFLLRADDGERDVMISVQNENGSVSYAEVRAHAEEEDGKTVSAFLSLTVPASAYADGKLLIGIDGTGHVMAEAAYMNGSERTVTDYLPLDFAETADDSGTFDAISGSDEAIADEPDGGSASYDGETDIAAFEEDPYADDDEFIPIVEETEEEADDDDEFELMAYSAAQTLEDESGEDESKEDELIEDESEIEDNEYGIMTLSSGYSMTAEAQEIYDQLESSWSDYVLEGQKEIVRTALTGMEHMTYASGTNRMEYVVQETPEALNCSGFVGWSYYHAGYTDFGVTNAANYKDRDNVYDVAYEDLMPGDIGSMINEDGTAHCGIYGGKIDGKDVWIHCTGGSTNGVTANNYSKFVYYSRYVEFQIYDEPGYYDVTDFGADGSDSKDDTSAIQAALDMAKDNNNMITVTVPAGTYYTTKSLKFSSGTTMILDDGAVIKRSTPSFTMATTNICDSEDGSGYGRASNITIIGGTWDGSASEDSAYHDMLGFSHCQNITIKDATFVSWAGYHAISLHGSRGVSVCGCTFDGFMPSAGLTSYTGEAVHLDTVSETSGGNTPYDYTPCADILVEGCTFSNCHGAIGNHHSDTPEGSNVTITGNVFKNITGACVRLPYFTDVYIGKNTVSGADMFCYIYNGSSDVTIADNDVDCGYVSGLPSNGNAVYIEASEASVVRNTIRNSAKSGINVKKNSSVLIQDNTISGCSEYGIYSDSSDSSIKNCTARNCEIDGIRINSGTVYAEGCVLEGNSEHDLHIQSSASGTVVGTNAGASIQNNSSEVSVSSSRSCSHGWLKVVTKQATCTENGERTCRCAKCGEEYVEAIPMTGHTLKTDHAVSATCTSTGLTEGMHCTKCGEIIERQAVIPKTDHSAVYDVAVAATCTKAGKTEGSHCGKCGAVLMEQEDVPATGHKAETVAAVKSTCLKTGLTEGSYCSVCGATLTAQKSTSKSGHSYKWVVDKEADYGVRGKRHQECTVCGKKTEQTDIAVLKTNAVMPRVSKNTKTSQTLKWNSVKGATKYVVYGARCGKSYEKLATVTGTTYTAKGLSSGKYYKYYIEAWNGSAKIEKSYSIHSATKGGKYGNPSSPSVKKSSISIGLGKSKTVKASVTSSKPVKLHVSNSIRWYSSDKSIATVNSKGVVAGKKKGTCCVYAVAQNGRKAKIRITIG